jgi:uncharacterized protein with PIN domain
VHINADHTYAYIQAIEGQQRMLNQQVGSVVGLLREREMEADRLRAELAASRFVCAHACLYSQCACLRVRMNELRIAVFSLWLSTLNLDEQESAARHRGAARQSDGKF